MLSDECKVAIEKWIDGNASEEDKAIIQQSSHDTMFNNQVELQKAVAVAIDKMHREELRSELKSLIEPDNNIKNIFLERKVWYAAAAILVVLVSSILFLSRMNTPSTETLYYSYYKPYKAGSLIRGDENDKTKTGFQLYNQGEYERAAAALEKMNIQQESTEGAYALLVLGNCYLNLNKTEKASKCFLAASRSSDSVIAAQANWYYALTLLKENNVSDATDAFERIVNSNSFYASQARQIVTDLRKTR